MLCTWALAVGVGQGLHMLRNEYKFLKWTEAAQFGKSCHSFTASIPCPSRGVMRGGGLGEDDCLPDHAQKAATNY
ncbi:hypothetical protein SeMB42_g01016 [Synchytrium endobioticum]|uniref:Uncharacterized protein n=1 Tax=Synchytrium endobioticum TaxID=286115 RepID=A0A507DQD6_9FUNG|nr:hypothetical protein SeMB42_g01016 [Synchytrium endobioticum]